MKTKQKAKKPAAKPARKASPLPAKKEELSKLKEEDFQVENPPPKEDLRWVEVECPYCGESFDVRVDPGEEGQSLVQDCQVCCKPVQLSVDVEEGEITVFASRG
ncbi:MAG: CPXCG motif-containing cysteine-rich protein [Elusimicrobia bacterium]|nr:CPXCG motif-containing cysteine-rich protein [Elusimicrobiota bacterium]